MSDTQKVRASHLLVKHSGSRRPASWRDPRGTGTRGGSVPMRQETNPLLGGFVLFLFLGFVFYYAQQLVDSLHVAYISLRRRH